VTKIFVIDSWSPAAIVIGIEIYKSHGTVYFLRILQQQNSGTGLVTYFLSVSDPDPSDAASARTNYAALAPILYLSLNSAKV
jgi:hypothetical protein